ncbi:hypothetical protein [Oerskovia turbata]
MTAFDYTARVAELLGEHSPRTSVDAIHTCACDWAPDDHWPTLAEFAAHQAEVLAAAGLIPTRTEWGVRYEVDRDRTIYDPHASEAAARRAVADSPTDHGLVSRPAHDWKDATDD